MTAKTDIDYKYVKELAEIQTPEREIAIAVGMTPPAFSHRKTWDLPLVEALVQGKTLGKYKLRNALYNEAMGKNTQILIHASKHWLDMKDNITISGDDKPLKIEISLDDILKEYYVHERKESDELAESKDSENNNI